MLNNNNIKEMDKAKIENVKRREESDRFSSQALLNMFILDRINQKNKEKR